MSKRPPSISLLHDRALKKANLVATQETGTGIRTPAGTSLYGAKAYRVQGLPLELKKGAIRRLLESRLHIVFQGSTQLRSVASAIDRRSKVVIFTTDEDIFSSSLDVGKDEWVLSLPEDPVSALDTETEDDDDDIVRPLSVLTIDSHFRGLTVIRSFSNAEDHHTDCIAITGLGGHVFGSFKHRESGHMWLCDSLPRDLDGARIMMYGYDSKVPGSRSFQDLKALASAFRATIEKLRASATVPDKATPLLFIAHSLGGLVVKEAIIQSHKRAPGSRISEFVYGGLFFGVPHLGMNIETLVPMVLDQPNQPLVHSLVRNSQVLRNQSKEFPEAFPHEGTSEIICFYETETSPTAAKDNKGQWHMNGPYAVLVDQQSATNGRPWEDQAHHVQAINLNHSQLVKFSVHSEVYDRVIHILRGFIANSVLRLQHRLSLPDRGYIRTEQSSQEQATKTDQLAQQDHPSSRVFDSAAYEKILQSLFYPEMTRREEQVSDPYKDTYQWIFHSEDDQQKSWKDFSEWLTSPQSIYWIHGKPGSGKSTLMQFIHKNDKTSQLLESWCSSRPLLTPAFFFWSAGSAMQKSIVGLLRSLLYQLLSDCPGLMNALELNGDRIHEWSEQRLRNALFCLLTQKTIKIAVFIMIDGLDEFEGRQTDITELVTSIPCGSFVKICISSRSLRIFENAFAKQANLQMQDFTSGDICLYVKKRLLEVVPVEDMNDSSQRKIRPIIETIQRSADGVFLWVTLVVNRVRESLQDGDEISDVARMVENLPPDVEALFMSMLRAIKNTHLKEASHYLQLALHTTRPLDLHTFHYANLYNGAKDLPLHHEVNSRPEISKSCLQIGKRLLTVTMGFLQLAKIAYSSGQVNSGDTDERHVDFFHRSIRDFLRSNEEATCFLNQHGSSKLDIHLSLARGAFARLLDGYAPTRGPGLKFWTHGRPRELLKYALNHLYVGEILTGSAQNRLLDSIDYSRIWHSVLFDPEFESLVFEPAIPFDLVGFAAGSGLIHYVCSKLRFAENIYAHAAPRPEPGELVEPEQKIRIVEPELCQLSILQVDTPNCVGKDAIRNSDFSRQASTLHLQEYRKALSSWLKPELDDSSICRSVAESYLLFCCLESPPIPSRVLVNMLLRAGANPAVEFHHDDTRSKSSWFQWIECLLRLRTEYMDYFNKSGSISLNTGWEMKGWTIDSIVETTKLFISNGISKSGNGRLRRVPTSRIFPIDANLQLDVWMSDLNILEECLGKHPNFQESIELLRHAGLVSMRDIEKVMISGNTRLRVVAEMSSEVNMRMLRPVHIDAEGNERLLPFLQKWEETGYRTDFNKLQETMQSLWEYGQPENVVQKFHSLGFV